MMKLTVKNATCKVRFRKFLGGSVLICLLASKWFIERAFNLKLTVF